MKIIKEFTLYNADIYEEDEDCPFGTLNKYTLFICPNCQNVTLKREYSDEDLICGQNELTNDLIYYSTDEVLYPLIDIKSKLIPPKVNEYYKKILKSRGIGEGDVCLMVIRQALEYILKDKGATEWKLKDKIIGISKKLLLPDQITNIAKVIKGFGDGVTHNDDNINYSDKDISDLIQLIKYLIEYLYVIPELVNNIWEKLPDNRKMLQT
jgi:hypothetical protein